MSTNLLVTRESAIAIVTVNRPEVRNVLDRETWNELRDTLVTLDNDNAIRVIIITGAGDKAFVAGADLNVLQKRTMVETIKGENSSILRDIEKIGKPVIAAINGFALGGGCELAMACDIRIASDNAKLGQTEINVGIIPGAGGTQRLTRLVGLGKALEMILTGDIITAQEAERIGLVNKVVPRQDLMAEAKKIAMKIIRKSPIVVKLAKASIKSGSETDFNTALLLETLCQSIVFGTEDHLEGINAFLEKRDPYFQGI